MEPEAYTLKQVMPWSSIGARVVLEPRTLVRLAHLDPAIHLSTP